MSDVFRMYGEKPTWDTEYTTLEFQQTGDSWEFQFLTHIEPLRARLIIDQLVNALFSDSKRTEGTIHLVDPLDQARDTDARGKPAVSRSPFTYLFHTGCAQMTKAYPFRMAIQWEPNGALT